MATIDRYISETASLKSRRSLFTMNRRVMTTYFHGYMQPIGVPIEVLPGDTWKAKVASLIEMSTPLRPLMDNIRSELDCFFVPKRILWNKTKQFYGEAETFGIATKVEEPWLDISELPDREFFTTNLLASENFFASLGLIREDDNVSGFINVLPVRAIMKCYNEFYRDQNYQNPFVWDMDETGEVSAVAYRGSDEIDGESFLPKVNKDKDLFISILPWSQKGDPVILSLGDEAPVNFYATDDAKKTIMINNGPVGAGLPAFVDSSGDSEEPYTELLLGGDTMIFGSSTENLSEGSVASITAKADLSSATSSTINQLLYSLAYQEFLTRAAHYGTKYKEYILSMFGTTIADATEDIPEYLGRMKMNININRVLSTVEQDQGLGEAGAFSVTGSSEDLFVSSFTEPGYLVFIGYCKHQRTYSSGIDKVFMKKDLLDYFQPPFATIGDVPIMSYELFAGGENVALGFQEPFYEYHSLQDRVYGVLNPLMPNSLAPWTLAERFVTTPTINGEFLEEDRTALIDALKSGENGPDYVEDFEFRFEATRVMPLSNERRLGVF